MDRNEEGVLVYPGWTGGTNIEGDLYYGGTTEAADQLVVA